MKDLAIKVEGISKCYQIYGAPSLRLKQFFSSKFRSIFRVSEKKYYKEFWALQDISFSVKKGDSFAILGRNGSGKSTLLQIISGVLSPSEGQVFIAGRVAALLELGAGFNPEFTGRENIYLNGSLIGMSRAEIRACVDDILDFADIGDFIDQPLKTYSSGMFVRLAFAVQINVNPDILIVDEALSVGDFFFQQKCFKKLREMREKGLTLLFVSHDTAAIRDLCSQAIYLKDGRTCFIGDSKTAIARYLNEKIPESEVKGVSKLNLNANNIAQSFSNTLSLDSIWCRDAARLTSQDRLLAVHIKDSTGADVTSVKMGEKLFFQICYRTISGEGGHISLVIKNKYDQVVTSTGSYLKGLSPLHLDSGAYGIFEIELDMMIEAGLYSLGISFGSALTLNQGNILDETGWIGPIEIKWNYQDDVAPFLGLVGLPSACRVLS